MQTGSMKYQRSPFGSLQSRPTRTPPVAIGSSSGIGAPNPAAISTPKTPAYFQNSSADSIPRASRGGVGRGIGYSNPGTEGREMSPSRPGFTFRPGPRNVKHAPIH